MNFVSTDDIPPLARWTTRIAVFSAGLAVAAFVLHRFLELPTTVALNLFKLSFAGGLFSLVVAFFAGARIWNTGEAGAGRIALGAILAVVLLAWPFSQIPLVFTLPEINDLSTDTNNPPPFEALAKNREPGANKPSYPGAPFASAQAEAYPDLQALEVERSSQEAFGLATDALRNKLFMTIVREKPPDIDTGEPGFIEAEDQTLIMGFRDDVAIRVSGDEKNARIDVRSASRYGRHDLGRNAERMRRILKELVIRLEETVPAPKPPENVTLKTRAERAEVKKQRTQRRKKRRRYYYPKYFFQ